VKASSSVVTAANEHVSIVTVLQMLGVDLGEDLATGRSRKVPCPFGPVYHSDHGVSPAMRVYPETNSAWCFSCAVYYTPVKLISQATDTDPTTAAIRLLDRVGYKPLELAEAWKNVSTYEPEPDKALMADALKTYCRRICRDWADRQFDARIAATLTRCLSILDLVRTDADVDLWLRKCKDAMRRTLNCEEPSLSEKYDVLLQHHDQQ
jgi:hypothetical protein